MRNDEIGRNGNFSRFPQAYASATEEAKGVDGKRFAEARRRATAGPQGCEQDVRN
ncbi:hypothetical protein DPPLL_13070 [Desulfofustis limnaeus]|uniref:Uncharacterized protein n=1 Tax=Desulfofustis limnaeus TaxID=2740163 RepID=A0ABM7W7S6_9BACT|nr:hypothetical protein DPPLL_13070 [Desulfofustis limnaeus]